MDRWPNQDYVRHEVPAAIDAGERALCVTSPTGGGKTVMQFDLLEWAASRDWPASMYTNRKMLTEQTINRLKETGIRFGVRAAGFDEYLDLDAPIQICSLQTEDARVWKSQKWLPHRSQLVLIDEAHLQKAGVALKVIDFHQRNDAAIVGFTATPVGISHIYKRLIVAGVTSELRSFGALVPAMVTCGAEIDTRNLKRQASGEFSLGEIIKKVWTPVIYGLVIDEWRKTNPDARPAILFGPGVEESAWFAKKFEERGVPAAHIDGEDVYVDGKTYTSSREARDDVLARFKASEIKVLCNRFVLREGIDIPECYQGILATPIGSVVAYIQIVGRILRAHANTPNVSIQDHGGSYWRHGSPNADRDWQSIWQLTDRQITDQRAESMRNKKEPEPIVCPECGAVRMKGAECYKCGHHHDKSVRMVIQKSGNLRPMVGDILHPREVSLKPDSQKQWEQIFWRMKRSGKTFAQAYGFFYHEHKHWLPRDLPLMPKDHADWSRRIQDVPFSDLNPQPMTPQKSDPQIALEFAGAR